MSSELRTQEQLRNHYEIEKELAARLRNTTKEERRQLYSIVYDELFTRVPLHPQLTRKADPEAQARAVLGRLKLLGRFLRPDSTYLEIGPGDCALALQVAKSVSQVYAIDVSKEIGKDLAFPSNFKLIISDGCSIPSPTQADIAFSDQLMEHLHPDDARAQLQNIYDALKPHGIYVCITPNRLSGPHDISQYFDDVAIGFHLKEYTFGELARIFKQTGFKKVRAIVGARHHFLLVPSFFVTLPEALLAILPSSVRKKLARGLPLRLLLGINLVGAK